MTYEKKQRKNRLDFSSLHQSNQSYDFPYDLQNSRDWPTVPLQLLMPTNIVLSVLRVQQAGCCTSLRPCRPAAAAGKTMRVRWHTRSILYGLMHASEPAMHHGGWIGRAWGAGACMYPDSRPHPPRRPTTTATCCCPAAVTGQTSA